MSASGSRWCRCRSRPGAGCARSCPSWSWTARRMSLRERLEALAGARRSRFTDADRALFDEFRRALGRGQIRAAERDASGTWRVNHWVKRGILLGFRLGEVTDMSAAPTLRFFDKDTYPVRPTALTDGVRIVP